MSGTTTMCNECIYWQADVDEEGEDRLNGVCRRRDEAMGWPERDSEDWCGEGSKS